MFIFFEVRKESRFISALLRISNEGVKEHQQLQRHKGWRLIYYEAYLSREDAVKREQMLKHYGSAKQGLLKRLEGSLKECDMLEDLE